LCGVAARLARSRGSLLRLVLRILLVDGGVLGFAQPVALALDADDVGVVDDAVDERGGTGGVREDGRPVLEGEIGREDEALPFVAAADDLEEEVGVAVVEGEVADLVELC